MTVAPHTAARIAELAPGTDRGRPLIICDADEVLVRFVATLEGFLAEEGLYLRFDSFALSGNIRRRDDETALPAPDVGVLVKRFFADRIGECPPVEGAVKAMAALSRRARILVLTNLPGELRQVREAALARHGLPYPVIANDGWKGPAVRLLAQDHGAPVVFLDDLPPNIASVAEAAPAVHRIHFVGDARLAPLLGPAEAAHSRIDSWAETREYLERLLAAAGH